MTTVANEAPPVTGTTQVEARYWAKVTKNVDTGCWEWIAARTSAENTYTDKINRRSCRTCAALRLAERRRRQ
jgi:hypothetical protein